MHNPRGSIVMPSRPINIGGAVATGRKPGLVVYTKAGSGRLMREFARFCKHWGIHAHPVQEVIGRPDAWECIGSVDALEHLIAHEAVTRWHYILNVKPPMGGQGGGEVTDRVRKAIIRSRLPRPERDAIDETERRSRLPLEERLDIALVEGRQLPGPWRPKA